MKAHHWLEDRLLAAAAARRTTCSYRGFNEDDRD